MALNEDTLQSVRDGDPDPFDVVTEFALIKAPLEISRSFPDDPVTVALRRSTDAVSSALTPAPPLLVIDTLLKL